MPETCAYPMDLTSHFLGMTAVPEERASLSNEQAHDFLALRAP
jgi:hypothetical protein